MFQFSPLAPCRLWIQRPVTRHDSRRVSPFGHPRINAYVRLPEAFRSLSRPSSPVRAKASTVRPCSLDRISSPATSCVSRRGGGANSGPPFLRTFAWCSRLLDASLHPTSSHTQVVKCNQGDGECSSSGARPVSAFDAGEQGPRAVRSHAYSRLQKGGDPAAGSPTATLLRLRPSHRARLRRLPPFAGLGHRLRALPTPMA
jgi:hypothetical protein